MSTSDNFLTGSNMWRNVINNIFNNNSQLNQEQNPLNFFSYQFYLRDQNNVLNYMSKILWGMQQSTWSKKRNVGNVEKRANYMSLKLSSLNFSLFQALDRLQILHNFKTLPSSKNTEYSYPEDG